MSSTLYALIHPVEISIPLPPRDGEAREPRRLTVRELALKPISARLYLELGDVSIMAASPGGGSYEVPLDDKIQLYLTRRVENREDPAPALAFKALQLADAMALRADLVEAIDLATDRAWRQRQGAAPDLVTLLEPVTIHNEVVRTVPLRCPTGADFGRFGEPYVKSRMADGSRQFVERTEVLAQYIRRSMAGEHEDMLLGYMSLADVIQVKLAVNDFFTAGVAEVNGARRQMLSSSAENTSPSATPAA